MCDVLSEEGEVDENGKKKDSEANGLLIGIYGCAQASKENKTNSTKGTIHHFLGAGLIAPEMDGWLVDKFTPPTGYLFIFSSAVFYSVLGMGLVWFLRKRKKSDGTKVLGTVVN